MKAKFELKENVHLDIKKKKNVPFTSLKHINDELVRLEKIGVLSKVDDSDRTSPTLYINKKSKEVRFCVDYSTGLIDALKNYHNPLRS